MKRQQRRRIKREWDKIPCFGDCTGKIEIEDLPNTAVDFFVKVNEDLMLQYNLDMFQRWRVYPIVVVDGFPLRDSFCAIGAASDEWMEDYFNDERFEGLNSYSRAQRLACTFPSGDSEAEAKAMSRLRE